MQTRPIPSTITLQPIPAFPNTQAHTFSVLRTILTQKPNITPNTKTTIPIKQYSNKFLRSQDQNMNRGMSLGRKIDPQKRFNLIFQKRSKGWIKKMHDVSLHMQSMYNKPVIDKPRTSHNMRIKTQETCLQKMTLIQNELLLQNPISNLLTPGKTQFHKSKSKRTQKLFVMTPLQLHTISHSRRLQLFNKIFAKSTNSIGNPQNKQNRTKTIGKQTVNNFQTKKIIPCNRKGRTRMSAYRRGRQGSVRVVDKEDDFQLVGWETPMEFNR